MTRDDIARMAREAGMFWFDYGSNDGDANMLEKFAALVAAHEREACAKLAGPHLNGEIAAAIRARGET